MFLIPILLGITALAVKAQSPGFLGRSGDENGQMTYYEMLDSNPTNGQSAYPYPLEHGFLQAEDWPDAKQVEESREREEWEQVKSADNLIRKARMHKRDDQASLSHYYYGWPSGEKDADYFQGDEDEMKAARPSGPGTQYNNRQPLNDDSSEARRLQALEEPEPSDRDEMNNDEPVKPTKVPLLAKAPTVTQPKVKQEIQEEEKQPKAERKAPETLEQKASADPRKAYPPAPLQNRQTSSPKDDLEQWRGEPPQEQQHSAVDSEPSRDLGDVQRLGSAKAQANSEANSLSFSISEAKQESAEAYNGERRPVDVVPTHEKKTISESSIKRTYPRSLTDEASDSFAKRPELGSPGTKGVVKENSLGLDNGASGSLPIQREEQSAKEESSYSKEDMRSYKPFINQLAPSQPSRSKPGKRAYVQEPMEDSLESKREPIYQRVIRRLAESKTADLRKNDELIPLSRSFRRDNPSVYGYPQPAEASYHLPKLLHKERYRDTSAAAATEREQPAYPDEMAVAFQPRLYGPKSTALRDGRFQPRVRGYSSFDSLEPVAHGGQLATAGKNTGTRLAHEPELTGSKLSNPTYVPRPTGSLDTSNNQWSRAQKAPATRPKVAYEPPEEPSSKASFIHVPESERSEASLTLQNGLGFASGQMRNGYIGKIEDRVPSDRLLMQPADGGEQTKDYSSSDTYPEQSKTAKQGTSADNFARAVSSTDQLDALMLPYLAPAPIGMAISEMIHQLRSEASQQRTTTTTTSPSRPSPEEGRPSPEKPEEHLSVRKGESPEAGRTSFPRQEQVSRGPDRKMLNQHVSKPIAATGERFSESRSADQEVGGSLKRLSPPSVRPSLGSLYHRSQHETKPESEHAVSRSPYSSGDEIQEKHVYAHGTSSDTSVPLRQISVIRRPDRLDFDLETGKPSIDVQYGPRSRIPPKKSSAHEKGAREKTRIPDQQQTLPKSLSYPGDAYEVEYKQARAPENHVQVQPLHWRDRAISLGLPPHVSGGAISGSIEQRRGPLEQTPVKSAYRQQAPSEEGPISARARPSQRLTKFDKAEAPSNVPAEVDRGSAADNLIQQEYYSENLMTASSKRPQGEAAMRRVQLLFEPPEPSIQGSAPRQFPAKVLAEIAPAYMPAEKDASKQRIALHVKIDKEPAEFQSYKRAQKVLPQRYGTVRGLNDNDIRQPEYDKEIAGIMRPAPVPRLPENSGKPELDQYQIRSSQNRTGLLRPQYDVQESAQPTAAYEVPVSAKGSVQAGTRREGAKWPGLPEEKNRAFQEASQARTEQVKVAPYHLQRKIQQERILKDDQASIKYKPEPRVEAISKEQLTGTELGKPGAFEEKAEGQKKVVPGNSVQQGRQSSDLPITQTALRRSTLVPKEAEKAKSEKESKGITPRQKPLPWESLTVPPFVPFLAKDGSANSDTPPSGGRGAKLLETKNSPSLSKAQFEKTIKESIKLEAVPTAPRGSADVTPVPTYPTQMESLGPRFVSPIFSLWGLKEKKWIDFNNGLREAKVQTFSATNQPWRAEVGESKEGKSDEEPSIPEFSPFKMAGKLLQDNLASFLGNRPLAGEYMAAQTPEPKKTTKSEKV